MTDGCCAADSAACGCGCSAPHAPVQSESGSPPQPRFCGCDEAPAPPVTPLRTSSDAQQRMVAHGVSVVAPAAPGEAPLRDGPRANIHGPPPHLIALHTFLLLS